MNLSELRKNKGISQEELAKALGVSQGAISAYETGRWEPSIQTIKKLASILDCTVDELLTDPREKLDAELRGKIESGEITPDEAEHEWHDRFAPIDEESPYRIW